MRVSGRVRVSMVIAVLTLLATWLASPALGQEVGLASRGPRFLRSSPLRGAVPVEIDASSNALLRRAVSLRLDKPTVGSLLESIEQQTGLKFAFNFSKLPANKPIELEATRITVAAALTVILLDTGLDVLLSSDRHVVFVERGRKTIAAPGTIAGRVTDAKTGDALAGAEVLLEGTRLRAGTNQNGYYKLTQVAPGSYTLSVRRLGYAKQGKPVAVTDGGEVTLDVALQPLATQLDELVTTVTGEQRLRELGHVVGRINADSLVKEAPISTVTELLSARVPGLIVQQHQGSVGGEVKLQIRSPSSIFLSNEPIVIVDGIRYTSSSRGGPVNPYSSYGGAGIFGVEGTSRLNDLNPHDIESIEVVKGPSAVTLYGTDAANGVIVVTTKRGRPGPAQWSAYASSDVRGIPQSSQTFPDTWWGWQSTGGVPSSVSNCPLSQIATASCVQDSIATLRNPLDNSQYSLYGSKPSWAYGASVAGGQPNLRYTVAMGLTDATSPLRLPAVFYDSIKAARGVSELPRELREPNTQTQLSLRSAVNATLSPRTEVQVQATYARAATRAASYGAIFAGPYQQMPTNPNLGGDSYQERFSQTSTEWTNRFTGSTGLTWRPWAWLQGHGTVGLDAVNSRRYSLARNGETPTYNPTGAVGEDRTQQIATTIDFGLAATLRRGRLSSRTAVGAQYTRTIYDLLQSTGQGLPSQGGSSLNEATTKFVSQSYNVGATLGTYVEQVFGLNDRLFLTGAVRLDGATGFGRHYEVTGYPKVGLSWLLSEEPLMPRIPGVTEFRLRYAFGASGRQPVANWTQTRFQGGFALLGGGVVPTLLPQTLGNPDLRPERVREHEFGLDAAALQNRVQFDLTWNYRRTRDLIVSWRFPYSVGIEGEMFGNLGRVDGHGFEASVTVRALETRNVTWDIRLQHSWQDNTVVERGTVPQPSAFLEGYPLGAFVTRPLLGYADANGDGILVASEVQLGDTGVYVGRTNVPRTQTLSTTVGIFAQRLRLSALFDRQSGAVTSDDSWINQCLRQICRAAVDPTTSLATQAQAVATYQGYRPVYSTDFTALREISAAFDLPTRVRQAFGLQSASVSIAARNLARWTTFKAFDPETNSAGRIPLARAWAFRVNAGF